MKIQVSERHMEIVNGALKVNETIAANTTGRLVPNQYETGHIHPILSCLLYTLHIRTAPGRTLLTL
jgi:hypothetical protein